MKYLFFILFYLLTTTNASQVSPLNAYPIESSSNDTVDKVCFLSYWCIFIYNDINHPITVHIQSKDDDLGNRTVIFKDYTKWYFCKKAGTLFYAHFYWNSRTAFFDVYDVQTAEDYCEDINPFKRQNCYWLVREDGFYLSRHYKPFPRDWYKLHDWL